MPDESQPTLLPIPAPTAEDYLALLAQDHGEHTGQDLQSKRPEDYKLVVALLARGWGTQRISDHFNKQGKTMSRNTVKAVRAHNGETIELLRARLAADAFIAADDFQQAASLLLDEILNDHQRRKKLTVRDVQSLQVAAGIAADKAQLLAGLPTARVAMDELRAPDHADWQRRLEQLPGMSAASVDPASDPSLTPTREQTTHLPGETPEQKEPPTEPEGPAPAPTTAADPRSDGPATNPTPNEH